MRTPENDLVMYRRHISTCIRYSDVAQKPPTYYYGEQPSVQRRKEMAADTCHCPIWCRGYLKNETFIDDKGRTRPILNKGTAMRGATDWDTALQVRNEWYEWGSYEAPKPGTGTRIEEAIRLYMEEREGLMAIVASTKYGYRFLFKRLVPYCKQHGLEYVDAFENTDRCMTFALSWRYIQRNRAGGNLSPRSRLRLLKDFGAFLNWCVSKSSIKMSKNGCLDSRGRLAITFGKVRLKEKYGLSNDEFARLVNAPYLATWPVPFEHEETIAACHLMRFCAMRPIDIEHLHSGKVRDNATRTGKVIDYIPIKTQRCEKIHPKPPLPDYLLKLLEELPGRMGVDKNGKRVKFYFQSLLSKTS